MVKRHPVRNLHFMKAIRDVPRKASESGENNQPVLLHLVILGSVCTTLKISENTVRRMLKEFETCNSPGKKVQSFHWVLL
jgi:hypothetical protein